MQLAHTCPTVACIYPSYPTCCVQIVTSFVMNFLQGIDLQPRDLGGKVSCILLWSRMQYFALTFLFGSHSPSPLLPFLLTPHFSLHTPPPLPLSLTLPPVPLTPPFHLSPHTPSPLPLLLPPTPVPLTPSFHLSPTSLPSLSLLTPLPSSQTHT